MKDTNIFSGHAQLPSGSDIYETYKYISIIVAVDMDTGMIVDCDVPILCKLSNDFISDIIKGNSFDDGIAQIIKTIDSKVHMLSKKR